MTTATTPKKTALQQTVFWVLIAVAFVVALVGLKLVFGGDSSSQKHSFVPSGGQVIKKVSVPKDDWSDSVDATGMSANAYPTRGGCYRMKVNGKLVTNGAGKHEICNGDDIQGGGNTDPRLILKFQSVEKTDMEMTIELFPKLSKI